MLGATVAVLRVDDYYRDLAHLSFETGTLSILITLMRSSLSAWSTISHRLGRAKSSDACLRLYPAHALSARSVGATADIILLEGVLAMSDSTTRKLVDYTIFVDTRSNFVSLGVLTETLLREAAQRLCARFLETRAEPMFAQFVAPWLSEADLVIDGSQTIDDELSRVGDWLQALIQDHQSL